MLEGLAPTPKPEVPKDWKPAVEFDGTEGTATTTGYLPDEKPDFEQFLEDAGFDKDKYEIVGEPRTSRWQVARPFPLDPQWLTAYRFRFRLRTSATLDLPTLYANAKRKPVKPVAIKNEDKAFIIIPADYQTGKVASRGGSQQLILSAGVKGLPHR